MSKERESHAYDDGSLRSETASLSAEQMLALATAQGRAVGKMYNRLRVDVVMVWGVAWFIGFLMLWVASPEGGAVVPPSIAWLIFGVLMVTGIVTSAAVGARQGRGLRGNSRFQGRAYGWTFLVAGFAPGFLGQALFAAGMPLPLLNIYYPAMYSLLVGLLYALGGIMWHERTMIGVGAWILTVGGLIAPFAGTPVNYLIMSILGGGAFLVYAAALAATGRRHG